MIARYREKIAGFFPPIFVCFLFFCIFLLYFIIIFWCRSSCGLFANSKEKYFLLLLLVLLLCLCFVWRIFRENWHKVLVINLIKLILIFKAFFFYYYFLFLLLLFVGFQVCLWNKFSNSFGFAGFVRWWWCCCF